MINTAILGYGKSANTFHLPFLKILEDFNVTTFVSSKNDLILKNYPHAKIYQDIDLLVKDEEVDLVVITTPSFLHYNQAKILLEAGKHLVVEKPFTVRSSEAQELVDYAKKMNLKLTVFQNRRWDSGFLQLKKIISENRLGDINYYQVNFDRWRPDLQNRWREEDIDGSGILYDLGVHLIDQAINLFGEPDSIISDIDKQRPGSKTVDYFHIVFKYAEARIVLHASCLALSSGDHIVVHGSKASFRQKELDQQEGLLLAGIMPQSTEWNLKNLVSSQLISSESKYELLNEGCYIDFYKQLAEAIMYDAPVPVDPGDSVSVIKIIEEISSSQILM